MGFTAATLPESESASNVGTPLSTQYYPFTSPPVGTALTSKDWPQNEKLPLLFTPITLGKECKVELKNRVLVAPMCQYSCETGTGLPNTHHLVHLGALAMRGASVIFTEAAAVLPNGRISPEDLGIWSDAHVEALKPITAFIKAQGALSGIQLAHSGRKGSTLAPWLDSSTTSKNVATHIASEGKNGGWSDVWAPSSIPFIEGTYPDPMEMGEKEITELKEAWANAVDRSIEAGFDVLEIHAAHGYLLHNFLSPISNQRTDRYGGSLENRMRLPLEIAEITRQRWPKEKLLFVRISASDWANSEKLESGEYISWGIEQSTVFLKELIKVGIDLLDVSSGGNFSSQAIKIGPGYQTHFAEALRNSLTEEERIPISSVGMITSGIQAEEILQSGKADVISVARELLRDADMVFNWAMELNTVVNVPVQYQRAYTRMMKK